LRACATFSAPTREKNMSVQDQLHRYLFENAAVRGELVNVSNTIFKQITVQLILD
jgi:hypothetical protein